MENDPNLQNPVCPECNHQLNRLIHKGQLTSYPPYGAFGCDHCNFEGFVMYEFTKEYKDFLDLNKNSSFKFSTQTIITNDEWLKNFKKMTN